MLKRRTSQQVGYHHSVRTKEGLLKMTEKIVEESRKLALIAHAKVEWANENPELAMRLEELQEARTGLPLKDDNGMIVLSWRGSSRWTDKARKLEMMRTNDPQSYEDYKKCLSDFCEITRLSAEFTRSKVNLWYDNQCAWNENIAILPIDDVVENNATQFDTYSKKSLDIMRSLVDEARIVGLQLIQ